MLCLLRCGSPDITRWVGPRQHQRVDRPLGCCRLRQHYAIPFLYTATLQLKSLHKAKACDGVEVSFAGIDADENLSNGGPDAIGAEPLPKAVDTSTVSAPVDDLRELIGIALPALGFTVAEPLMSLLDTACVGQVSSLELAALGPNTALFNLVFQVFCFVGVTTTNLVATHSLRAPGLSDAEVARRRTVCCQMVSYALSLALLLSMVSITVMTLWGTQLLKALGATESMLEPGLIYLTIRSLASPAVLVCAVLTGMCVGQQNTTTPLIAVMLAALLNLVGDVVLILVLGWGIRGAAIATTASQYAAALYVVVAAQRQAKKQNGIPLRFAGIPTYRELQPFLRVGTTLICRSAVGMMAYTAMTATATSLGTVPAAAHQVALQIFWFLSFFPEPISLAAQSLMARDLWCPPKLQRLPSLLLGVTAVVSVGLAALTALCFVGIPWLFTKDAAVINMFKPLVVQAVLAEVVCSFVLMFDGIGIGTGNSRHLAFASSLGLIATLLCCGAVKLMPAARASPTLGLNIVWWSLVLFLCARAGYHMAYHWTKKSAVFDWGKLEPKSA